MRALMDWVTQGFLTFGGYALFFVTLAILAIALFSVTSGRFPYIVIPLASICGVAALMWLNCLFDDMAVTKPACRLMGF